jgi:glutathione S-transferase
MGEWLDVESARGLPGLRLVLTAGVPGPWGEAAKGVFDAKKVPYARVRQVGGEPNPALVAWTGHSNAPQAVWQDEPARTGWNEIIELAERIAPEPALLPADPAQRAEVIGLCALIAAPDGIGWLRRLMIFHDVLGAPESVVPANDPRRALVAKMAGRYGYSREAAERAPARTAAILDLLSERLERSARRGSRYFTGDSLSALDVYWAAFAAMLEPLPPELCPMPEFLRPSYAVRDPLLRAAAKPGLLAHRDFVYRRHLVLPVAL